MVGFGIRSAAWIGSIRALALGGTALVSLQASALHAQSAATPAAEEDTAAPDIIVTAERRATSLQNTPLSILAVTQEAVEAKGIQDLQDLSHFTPNLSISPTRGSGSSAANFVIRGISGGGGATGERGVGLYVDGVYMPRTSGAVLRVLDVDRIEVLRGPQGTLFGRNSTGGAIRIFSKQPTDKLEGSLEGKIGNFGHYEAIGMINIPIGEGVAVRAQAAYIDEDGYVSRGTQMLGAQRDYVWRSQFRADLTPDFKVTAGFLYNKTEANATAWVMQTFDMRDDTGLKGIDGVIQGNYGGWLNDAFKGAGQAPLAPFNDSRIVRGDYKAPDVCLIDNFNPDYSSACNQFNNDRYWQADLKIDWTIGEKFSVHSITGLSNLKHRAVTDWELIGMEMRYDFLNSQVFYQELQANASLFDDAVDLVTGASYFHEKSAAPSNYILNRRGTASYPSSVGNPANSDGGLYTRSISDVFQTSESWGLFASGTWHVTNRFNVTGGLRQAWDYKDYRQTRYPSPATPYQPSDFTVAPGTTSTTVQSGAPFHALDYRLTLDYHLTDDVMAYGTISKAYKAGSFSYTLLGWTAANQATGANQSKLVVPVPNEKVVNYEVGLRTSWFNRRLKFNPTGFLMHYTNRQAVVRVNCGTGALVNIPLGSPDCPSVGFIPLLQDQGDAWIRGIELDGQFVIAKGLTIDGSYGLTDYTLKNPPVGTTHLYPDIPKHSYNVGATYSGSLDVAEVMLNLNYAFVGRQSVYPDDTVDSGYILPSYGLVNARVQVTPKSFPVTFSVAANNLLDNVYATYAQKFGGGFWDSGAGTGLAKPDRYALSVVRGRPREVTFSVKYRF